MVRISSLRSAAAFIGCVKPSAVTLRASAAARCDARRASRWFQGGWRRVPQFWRCRAVPRGSWPGAKRTVLRKEMAAPKGFVMRTGSPAGAA